MEQRTGRMDKGLKRRATRTARLVRVLVPREVRLRYRQSSLNVAWALLSPVAILAVYGVVLTQGFGVGSTCAPYLVTAWTGLVLWTFFASSVGGSVWSLLQSADLISKLYFPREALPLGVVGASLVDLAVGLLTVVALAVVQGSSPGIMALYAVLPVLSLVLWTAAISIFVAVLAAFARDVTHAVNLLLRVGFFATAVMFEASFLPTALAWTAKVNPVTVAITELRNVLLCNTSPSFRLLGLHLLGGALALAAAVAYTRSVESRIVDAV